MSDESVQAILTLGTSVLVGWAIGGILVMLGVTLYGYVKKRRSYQGHYGHDCYNPRQLCKLCLGWTVVCRDCKVDICRDCGNKRAVTNIVLRH